MSLPPTCYLCGGIGHNRVDHDAVLHTTVPIEVIRRHVADLRSMANDLRDHLGPIATPLHISHASRAEAYDLVADRLEKEVTR